MRTHFKILICLLSILFGYPKKEMIGNAPKLIASTITESFEEKASFLYNNLDANNFEMPQFQCFTEGVEGFFNLRETGKISKDILTIIDFSLPSTAKRLWVIDLNSNTILFNSLVAHGSGSGGNFANRFSNSANSNKSSLGFYSTAEIYNGKHGLSLKLDGLEKGINSNARNRGIVIHGADYANKSILNSQGYLGRSQGCPALPIALSKKIIGTIKNKSCLFIYHPLHSHSKSKKSILMA